MVIGFETVAYEVSEGQNQEFCVAVLNGELESPVEVTLTTEDGTALGEAVALYSSVLLTVIQLGLKSLSSPPLCMGSYNMLHHIAMHQTTV